MDSSFIQGLIAGEGCFTVQLGENDAYRFGVRINPMFRVEMVENGDILEYLHNETGLGRFRDCGNSKAWRIDTYNDVLKFIKIVESTPDSPFWLTDKASVFKDWKDIVELKGHQKRHDKETIKLLVRKTKALNKSGNDGHTLKHWLDIINRSNYGHD